MDFLQCIIIQLNRTASVLVGIHTIRNLLVLQQYSGVRFTVSRFGSLHCQINTLEWCTEQACAQEPSPSMFTSHSASRNVLWQQERMLSIVCTYAQYVVEIPHETQYACVFPHVS